MSISQNKVVLSSDLNPLPIANGGTGVKTLEDLKNTLGIKNNTPDYFIAEVLPVLSYNYNYVLSTTTRRYVDLPYPVDLSKPWRVTVVNFGSCFTAKASTTGGTTMAFECGLSNDNTEYELDAYNGCTVKQTVITSADDWCLYPHKDEIWLLDNCSIIMPSGYEKGEWLAEGDVSISDYPALDNEIYTQIYYRGMNAANYKPGICGLAMIFERIH